jgi:nitroreductase
MSDIEICQATLNVKEYVMKTERIPDHPIDPVFLDRWSPRAYDATSIPASDLLTILEAARWAPSAYNVQPWRFLYSLRGDAHWQRYLELLDPFNASWARHASAMVVVLSDTVMTGDGSRPQKPSRTHSFDAGAAWAQLALQATSLGYQAHAMAGIHFDQSQENLAVPERYRVEIAIAIGKRADPSVLPEELQDREQPSQRLSVREIAFAGSFPQ